VLGESQLRASLSPAHPERAKTRS